ncbi:putative riboflavin-aldehyde forming enzyme protein [Rosellinia necatrix]|uniref:Putative riboflavin-aldehyde forming enzyme protein n=1 Tax=Rosellinia necatrix TaxID=77044 RepID=A0A1W2TTC7_ROSNE|nr:putative riboflavin-aldehyde forming enzyme protein [Rosellinia necatrix]
MVSLSKLLITIGLAISPAMAYAGDMTWYKPGLGSCGWTNSNNDNVVALSPSQSGNCGKSVRINYQGKSVTAKVVDKCPGCASGSIDVSPAVFDKLASRDLGRVKVTWDLI